MALLKNQPLTPNCEEIEKVLLTLAKQKGASTMLHRLGTKYDAFKVLISTILSARARDEVTEVISEELFKHYPTAQKLALAKPKEIIQIIRKIGFYNNKAKNIISASQMVVEKFNGKVPDTLEQLIEIPGVGRKVANCVLVYVYKQDAIPVDTHVHRIANRLGWVKTKTPQETELALEKIIPKKYWQHINEALVMHGKTICSPISPHCSRCPVFSLCQRHNVTNSR